MKIVKNAFLALIVPLAGSGCLEEPASDDSPAVGPTGSSPGPSQTTGPTNTAPGATGGTGGTPAATTPAGMTGAPGAGGTGGSTPMNPGATGAGGTGGAEPGPGSTGAGGMGAGGMGAGGAGAGGAGGMGGDGEIDPDTFIPGLDGLFMAYRTTNPEDPGNSKYWLTGPDEECPAGDSWATSGVTRSNEYQVMGTPGEKYTVHFQLRGALSLRCYTDGTPTGMVPDPAGINQAFYVGGQQFGDSSTNTLELAVTPAVMDEAASTYFLNGIPSTSEMCDEQITYDVQYEAQFVVMGDSTITISTHASDCQALQNCGADPGAGCDPRVVDVSGVQVKASPMQPIFDYVNGMEFYPQWFVFDIQSITSP